MSEFGRRRVGWTGGRNGVWLKGGSVVKEVCGGAVIETERVHWEEGDK